MKKKLVITLLLTALATTSLAGCGKKETANVPAEGTEVVAEIDTETEAEEVVVAETETEEVVVAETEKATESEPDTEVVAKNDNKDSDKAETKADGSKTGKTDAGKTESSKNESNNSNKNNGSTSTNNNAQTEQPSAPVETPAETPAVETPVETPAEEPTVSDQPTTGPEATTAVCPYTVNTWMDMGDGWWGCYKAYIDSKTPEENATIGNEVDIQFQNKLASENLTYDDSYSELIGNYDGISSVLLVKYHLVPAPEGAYDPQD